MARVLVAANSSWNLQNFRTGLIRELLRDGHAVTTISPDSAGVEIDGAALPHRTWAMDRSGTSPFRELGSIRALARALREERPDIFFSFTIKPNIYGCFICRILDIPAAPNVSGLGTAFLGRGSMRRAVLLMYRVAFARTKKVFFQNPDDRELFLRERVVRTGQAVLLPGSGIDLSHFTPSALPGPLRFLMVARLLGDKGVREYVAAAAMVRERFPHASFGLLGELDRHNRSAVHERELQSWVASGAVEYLGVTSDVRPFIRDATAVVLPSYREGLPRTLLEAAAMARPLIGTDVPGCREVVRDGVTGFLCRARDPSSLAAAMRRLAETPEAQRAAMGAAARRMAQREFDEKVVFRSYLDALRAALA